MRQISKKFKVSDARSKIFYEPRFHKTFRWLNTYNAVKCLLIVPGQHTTSKFFPVEIAANLTSE